VESAEDMGTNTVERQASIDAEARRGLLGAPIRKTPRVFRSLHANGGGTPPPGRPKAGSANNRNGRSPRTTVTPFLGKGEGGKANHAA
jgi:hypothetical protein